MPLASHADVLTGSSRNHSSPKTRDEPLRTFAWEASMPPDARAFGARDYPPPPPNKSNLATALF